MNVAAQAPPVIPPIPNNPAGAFLHVLEHVIGLDTQPKRDKVTLTAGVTEAEGLLYVETDSLLDYFLRRTQLSFQRPD